MSVLRIDATGMEKLQQAMETFQGNTEAAINEVLHEEAGPLIQDAVKRLMPVSGKRWKGKKPPAKTSKSLRDETGNLFVTVKTSKNYQYLYFPDDGTNTRRHVGNQQFFRKGGELQQDKIIDLCIGNLLKGFEDAMNG